MGGGDSEIESWTISYSIDQDGKISVDDYSWYPLDGIIKVPTKVNGKDVTGLLGNCFYNIKSHVYSVELPACISSVCDYAFEDLTNLTVVTINNENAVIEDDAFSGCTSLQQIIVKSEIVQINGEWYASEFPSLKIVCGATQYSPADYPGSSSGD